jgi:hypothetical protein
MIGVKSWEKKKKKTKKEMAPQNEYTTRESQMNFRKALTLFM